jgi:1-acyl-sn-glycerol-3-phosphate acyltransferase
MQMLLIPLRAVLAVFNLVFVCGAGVLLVMLGMNGHKTVRRILPRWARLNLLVCGLKLEVLRGAEHLQPGRPVIFIANHQALIDLFVFPVLFRDTDVFYPVKKELAWVPFLGWLAWISGQPLIDRDDHARAMQAMDLTIRLLRAGMSSVIFPEGTRSRDGKLGPFKKGAFRVALDHQIPLVPITLVDCADRMPMGTWRLTSGTIHVVVDPPILVDDWSRSNLDENIDKLRNLILGNLETERSRLGLPPM